MRTIAILFILGCLQLSKALAELPPFAGPRIVAEFDQELFELAHSVFLANSSLAEALAITELALQARPTDKIWLARGAEVAEWAGRPDLALHHWFVLAQQGNKSAALSALRISRSMNELPLRKQLLEQMLVGSATLELQKEYLAVVESLGLSEEAYTLLASGRMRTADPVWQLTEQARIAEALGRPGEAFAAWEKRAVLKPLTTDESLQLASLWYGRGDTEQASRVLRHVSPVTPYKETAFWRTYSDLAWSLQKVPEAIKGSLSLIREGAGTEADYQRIQLTFQESDPEFAFPVIREGWQRFSKPVWWYAMVETGLRCGRARELAGIYNDMTPEQRSLLSGDGRSLYLLALVHRQNGKREASLSAARRAMQLEQDNALLLSGYLWLLVDLRLTEVLRPLVFEWETGLGAIPELREPLAAVMMLLGEPSRALPLYRALARSRHDDPAWLASYGDALERAGNPEAAWQVRRHAQYLVTERIIAGTEPLEAKRRDLLTQAGLMMHLSPGDRLTDLVRRIAEGASDDATELVMGWAMTTGQDDLARLWYWRNFALAVDRPEWLRLGSTIEGNVQTGMTRIVESLAFEHLRANPNDHLSDQQLRAFAVSRPGFVRYSMTLEDQAGVGWLQNRLSLSRQYNGRYDLKAEVSERQFALLKHDVIGNMPRHDIDGGVTVNRRHEGGYLSFSLGMRDGGYNNFGTTALEGNWRPYRDLNLAGRIDYNGRSEESALLSVAGVRDRLRLSLTGTMTPNDTLALELAGMRYHDQHRHYLGSGMSAGFDLRHQITGAWPDYGVRSYGGYTATAADGTLSADTVALLPANAAPSASSYIPGSFGQVGVGAFMGQAWKSAYTRDLKPFAEFDIGWTTNAGIGYSYGVGLVSPIIGADQLKLELHQGSGQFGFTGLTSIINLEYQYLY